MTGPEIVGIIAGIVGLAIAWPMHAAGVLSLRAIPDEVFDRTGAAAEAAFRQYPALTTGPRLIRRARTIGLTCVAVAAWALANQWWMSGE